MDTNIMITNEQDDDSLESDTLYCICKKKNSESAEDDFMIECDLCKDWLHFSCINLNQLYAKDIDTYVCPRCTSAENQTIYKKRNNYHRHDFHDVDAHKKPVQAGTAVFIDNLLKKVFINSDEIIIKLHGSELKVDYFEKNGFNKPILVEKKDDLDFKVPPSDFDLTTIEQLLGSDYDLEVIDVEKQQTISMKINALRNYFDSTNRNKIYNLISLEISKTRLDELVTMPRIVREISWVSCGILPPDSYSNSKSLISRPDVQKYCLISARGSYTDFHIDFGGSSVWYHVLKGSKLFYIIEPTDKNLTAYETWAAMVNNTEIQLSDQVGKCYICELKEGNTIFLPTGYIHAVYTPSDSIVFGGNFEQSYNIPLQIKIYELENRLKVPQKFRFPGFQLLHWHAARYFTKKLKALNKKNLPIQEYLYIGCKVLRNTLKKWYYQKNHNLNEEMDEIPDDIPCDTIIRVLSKELKKSKILMRKSNGNDICQSKTNCIE